MIPQGFPGKSGMNLLHPPKLCASIVQTSSPVTLPDLDGLAVRSSAARSMEAPADEQARASVKNGAAPDPRRVTEDSLRLAKHCWICSQTAVLPEPLGSSKLTDF